MCIPLLHFYLNYLRLFLAYYSLAFHKLAASLLRGSSGLGEDKRLYILNRTFQIYIMKETIFLSI